MLFDIVQTFFGVDSRLYVTRTNSATLKSGQGARLPGKLLPVLSRVTPNTRLVPRKCKCAP